MIENNEIISDINNLSIRLQNIEEILQRIDLNKITKDDFDVVSSFLRIIAVNQLMDEVLSIDECREILYAHQAAYLFFNCDENKSSQSMNVLYNNRAYDDTPKGRSLLLARIIDEKQNQKIQIREEDMDTVKEIIMDANPEDASKYLKYGCIVKLSF